MSEGSFAAPPPPPPPRPPAPPATPAFDFVKPFAFVFEDARWLQKVLIGGLFFLASFLLVGIPFLAGYMAKLVRNVIAGMERPLPEWDDLGEMFSEGVRLFLIAVLWFLPIVVVAIAIGIPAAIMSGTDEEILQNIGGGVLGCAWCLIVPLSLAVTFFMPAALLMAVVDRTFAAGFQFGRIWRFIRDNIGNYLLAIVVYLVARFAAGLGVVLLCIGVVFTEFWGMCVTGFAFAQVYRLSSRK